MTKTNNIDRQLFYEEYRKEFGMIKLNKTVETIESIFNRAELEKTPVKHLSYMFATAYHEARDAQYQYDFYPIMERGSWNYIVNQYWYNSKVRGWLGNTSIDRAYLLRGRGLVQITGETNYKRFGLLDNPDKALEPETAVTILFDGMNKGVFTGKKLLDYINDGKADYVNARRIVNGTDKAQVIAFNADKFEVILQKSNIE